MDWQDNEFEGFLKRFRLREARPLPGVDAPMVPKPRVRQWRIAAAAVLVVAVGASAAIVQQLRVKAPAERTVQKTPVPKSPEVSISPVATSSQSFSKEPQAQTPAPPVKLDPRPKDPMKQLIKVMPPAQDAGPQSTPETNTDPKSPGEQILNTACGSCHGVDLAGNAHFETRQEYVSLVNRMAGMGASVSTEQAAALSDYLFKMYGKKREPGEQILNTACGSCHAVDLAGNAHFETRQEYVSLVNRMAGMGASVSTEQAAVLSDYLFKTYGKKKEPEDPGKAAFTAACGQCHSLELMDNRKDGERAAYEALVNRMNDYGAGLTPGQIDPLVNYLFRTYGRKLLR